MPSLLRLLGQIAFYGAVALATYWFSVNPVYRQVPAGMAQIKLSFKHGGARVEDCRRLTTEELSKLPSTERRPTTCARERLAIAVRKVEAGDVEIGRNLVARRCRRGAAAGGRLETGRFRAVEVAGPEALPQVQASRQAPG